MKRPFIAALVALAPFLPATSGHAQQIATERLVLRAFNVCLDAETGGDLGKLATEQGFIRDTRALRPVYYRDMGSAVIFLAADFGPGADGKPEPACRITALRPQIDTPYNPRRAIFADEQALMDGLVGAATQRMNYAVVAMRQPHPARQGHQRTVLKSSQGARGKMIVIERGPTHYEFLYVHAARSVIDDPRMPDMALDPAGRLPQQALVDANWEAAFCKLNPHACATEEQRRAQSAASPPSDRPLPFSGIGKSGAPPLSTLEKDYHDNKNSRTPYVIRERKSP